MDQKKYWCPSHPEVQSDDSTALCVKCGTMVLISNPNFNEDDKSTMSSLSQKKSFKDFLPLILIFFVVVAFTSLMVIFVETSLDFAMRMFMGSFFAIFGAFKLFKLQAFADAYSTYDIIAKRSRIYALSFPFIELAFAVLYLFDFGGIIRDLLVFVVMGISTIGVVIKLRAKEEIPCACLGMVFILPMTWVTLLEDLLMTTEALLMVLMPIGFNIVSSSRILETLDLQLTIHTSSEWVRSSELAHLILGIVILWFLFASIIKRFIKSRSKLWDSVRIFGASLFILFGLMLSIGDYMIHGLQVGFQSLNALIANPTSQWFQHFLGGLFVMTAGITEIVSLKRKTMKIDYVAPIFVSLTGLLFFFHQQLGALDAVIYSMTWHMTFGAVLLIGGIIRVLDLFMKEERKGFFTIWVIMLVLASYMMISYKEPAGSYEKPSKAEIIEFDKDLIDIKNTWILF